MLWWTINKAPTSILITNCNPIIFFLFRLLTCTLIKYCIIKSSLIISSFTRNHCAFLISLGPKPVRKQLFIAEGRVMLRLLGVFILHAAAPHVLDRRLLISLLPTDKWRIVWLSRASTNKHNFQTSLTLNSYKMRSCSPRRDWLKWASETCCATFEIYQLKYFIHSLAAEAQFREHMWQTNVFIRTVNLLLVFSRKTYHLVWLHYMGELSALAGWDRWGFRSLNALKIFFFTMLIAFALLPRL